MDTSSWAPLHTKPFPGLSGEIFEIVAQPESSVPPPLSASRHLSISETLRPESCKRHGIEPQAYLTDILKKLPSMTNHEAVELTPDKGKDKAN